MGLVLLDPRLRRTDGRFVAAGLALVTILAFLDCVVYQQLRGQADAGLAARWLLATIPPWAIGWIALTRIGAKGRSRWLAAGAVLAAALIGATAADMILFPQGSGDLPREFAQRVQARLPIALALLLLASPHRPAAEAPAAEPAVAPRWQRLAGCDLCRAAGNYVEVVHGARSQLVRARLSDVEGSLRHFGYVRVHRSVIVARRLIVAFENDRDGLAAVRLADGRRVKVGRSYRSALYALRRNLG
jgi:hypothetical protein